MEVVYTQICEFSHAKRTGRKGDLAQRVMRSDSFQIRPLFVWLYCAHSCKHKENAQLILSLHWLLRTVLAHWPVLITDSPESRLSVNARSRATLIQTLLCQGSIYEHLRDFTFPYRHMSVQFKTHHELRTLGCVRHMIKCLFWGQFPDLTRK